MNKKAQRRTDCSCGSGLMAGECCSPYLAGTHGAPTAEALMRSRYVAYQRCDAVYLMKTWHVSTRPAYLELIPDDPHWTGLKVKQHLLLGERAIVEFIATYKVNGRAHRLHETSRFVREGTEWFYVDGDHHKA